MSKINKNKKGFLMVELIMAVAVFVVVMVISLGSVVNVLHSSRRVRANKDVMDSLNASLEYMARTVRFGKNYHCGSTGTLSVAQNCTDNANGDTFLAVNFEGGTLVYRQAGTSIEFSEDTINYKPLTAPNVIIDRVRFYVFGAAKTDNIQPYVLAVIRGRVANDSTGSAFFDVQTIMSQREIDLNLP